MLKRQKKKPSPKAIAGRQYEPVLATRTVSYGPRPEEIELRSRLESQINLLINDAPHSEETQHQLEVLRAELPSDTTLEWTNKLKRAINGHVGVIKASVASRQFADSLELVRSTNNADNALEVLIAQKRGRSSALKDADYPQDWNELLVQFSASWPQMADFVGLKIADTLPDKNRRSAHLHKILDDHNVVFAAYVIIDYNGRDDESRWVYYGKPIGAQLGILLYQLESMVNDFRRDPVRFNQRHQRATTPS